MLGLFPKKDLDTDSTQWASVLKKPKWVRLSVIQGREWQRNRSAPRIQKVDRTESQKDQEIKDGVFELNYKKSSGVTITWALKPKLGAIWKSRTVKYPWDLLSVCPVVDWPNVCQYVPMSKVFLLMFDLLLLQLSIWSRVWFVFMSKVLWGKKLSWNSRIPWTVGGSCHGRDLGTRGRADSFMSHPLLSLSLWRGMKDRSAWST